MVAMVTRGLMFLFLAGAAYFGFNQFLEDNGGSEVIIERAKDSVGMDSGDTARPELDIFMPTSTTGQIVKHDFYALSYNEKYEVPEWVAYELKKSDLYKPNVQRSNDFRPDNKVRSGSATKADYKRSGYDRGHLAPAGDMAFSSKAMSETFYMSNMTPQIHVFNSGIWRELEETIRDWTKKFRHLYVVTGPVLTEKPQDYIGNNDVAVSRTFYKVLLDNSEPELKGIGFVIPHKVSDRPLGDYAVTIDEVEKLTGIDFFPELIDDPERERQLEGTFDLKSWEFSDRRYRTRVDKWNKDVRR